MRNPWLALWLSGSGAWMGAAHGPSIAEMQREQMRMIFDLSEQAIQAWCAAWMLPMPANRRPVAERMAALSLRVVTGGRR